MIFSELYSLKQNQMPDFLSCFPEKLELYSTDFHFQKGWATLIELEKQGLFSTDRVWALGSVLFKVDSMLRGNAAHGIHFLEEHGFIIRAARVISLSSNLVTQFWKYSLGRLSHERIDLLKRLQSLSPSLYLLIEAPNKDSRLPCTLQVTEFKGQVVLSNRKRGTLRYAMGEPQSAFFNFVHTADEPADLVRELGLLFSDDDRQKVILDVAKRNLQYPQGLCQEITENCLDSDLNFQAAFERVKRIVTSNLEPRFTGISSLFSSIECFDKSAYGDTIC